ncbi:carbon catabolite repressor protein 4 homolog 6 isoform X2 [Phalaenopsis equestris]|uniref:carbon catabolite repressor protein 4 homolog 6 isoform X2 n=1 Tax=Phalaenopsis equestris TaxID=78828 RepID=UPI0009E3E354|nr:carbon catabolite repressor protein 4 homolog 6 isoform X2 [Phalaenopsis equestris]XP_020580808.1 carbon catabolite repressor protein 4 homolog 6 isoform X2 [Phalaenopsis equestris]
MPLSCRSLQFIEAVTSIRTFKASMSSSNFNARGRNQWRRSLCDRTTTARGCQGLNEVDATVSGDSHVGNVRAANYRHRQGYAQQQFRPWRPSVPPFRAGVPPKSADHRNWIFAASQPAPDQERFKVLSYNILADYLALDHQSTLYFHIPNHILAWEWRKRRLFIEFGLWSPDIMCLQEVDQFSDLEGELAIRGYAGIWKRRTGNAVDGCAIFWRTNRFQLRHEEHIEFSKLGLRDNVAQICVLESNTGFPAENAVLPASHNPSSGGNQVVVCNTHVLYNPKRGEIKLGQVRILFDRASVISRAWNDAPVIVCGDFNSIPMSPLYKFIATRKLNLSGLTRDQISGQYSATLHNRPYFRYRPQTFSRYGSEGTFGDNKHNMGNSSPIEKPAVTLYQDLEQKSRLQMSPCATAIKLGEAEIFGHQGGEVSSTYLEFANMPSRTSEFFIQQSINHASIDAEKNREEAHKNILVKPCSEGLEVSPGNVDFADEIKLTSKDNTVNYNNVGNSPFFHSNKDDFSTMDSSKADDSFSEKKIYTSGANLDVQIVENTENPGNGDRPDPCDFARSHVSHRMGIKSNIEVEKIIDNMNSVGDSKNIASENIPEEAPALCGNLSRDATSTENREYSKLSGLDENVDGQSPVVFGMEENADPNFFKELLGMEDDNQITKDVSSPNLELQEDSSFFPSSAVFNVETSFYNPYCWSPMEMEIASGNAKCTVVEHTLKLRSVYTDVEDYTGTKDSSREPQVTSYNQQFMGTVDYIWCSEDLQTVKVLDTIPKHILQRTSGFPTQKWGSDHIALACELAFSKVSQTK